MMQSAEGMALGAMMQSLCSMLSALCSKVSHMNSQTISKRLPPWFKIRLTTNKSFVKVQSVINKYGLHTVCQSAACLNRNECWNSGAATFLLLGNICTRGCRFCSVSYGVPSSPDPDEPERIADAIASLGLAHAVLTSVTRDDLSDGGARIFQETIRAIRDRSPNCRIEVLIPDLQGNHEALDRIFSAAPDIVNHNIETVPSLYPRVRPQALYKRSLDVLAYTSGRGITTKSGIMVGLGEEISEVSAVLKDLRSANCSIVTIGQYLQPSPELLPVARYYRPDEFTLLREMGIALGFTVVASGPRVRSSYHAAIHGNPVEFIAQ